MAMLLVSMKRLRSSGMFVRSPIAQNCVQRVRGSEIAQRITGYIYLTLCHTYPSHLLQPPPRSQVLASTEPLPTLCAQADFDTCSDKKINTPSKHPVHRYMPWNAQFAWCVSTRMPGARRREVVFCARVALCFTAEFVLLMQKRERMWWRSDSGRHREIHTYVQTTGRVLGPTHVNNQEDLNRIFQRYQ